MEIPTHIDPDNILQRFKGQGSHELFYGPDNKVRYYEMVKDDEGKK